MLLAKACKKFLAQHVCQTERAGAEAAQSGEKASPGLTRPEFCIAGGMAFKKPIGSRWCGAPFWCKIQVTNEALRGFKWIYRTNSNK